MRAIILAVAPAILLAQTAGRPVRSVTDPGVVTTRQAITPAGIPAIFNGRVHGVAFGAPASRLWVLNGRRLVHFDFKENRVLSTHELGGNPGLQGVVFDPVRQRPLVSGSVKVGEDWVTKVRLVTVGQDELVELAAELGKHLAGAPAVARKPRGDGRRIAAIPLLYDNKLAILNAESGELLSTVPTSIAPFGVALNENGTEAFVTNWGGRLPQPKDLSAPMGFEKTADRMVVDARGVAASGTVTRFDLISGKAVAEIAVDLAPTGIVWDEARARVYVANNNADSVSVIDTKTNRLLYTWPIQPFSEKAPGVAPTALALSADGTTLYVACGGINAVAVLSTARAGAIDGLIPTAWYPNALSLSPDGRQLAVASLLGAGSGWREEPSRRHALEYRGAVHVVEIPDKPQLASYTTAVAENNRLSIGPAKPAARPNLRAEPVAIPARSGEPSLIEHVVYIIKENRTYDQVFGDLPQGNGDPSLVMFGEDVTPNHRRLAKQFVLLDNFYATGGNSADGHQWLTQGNEVGYVLWPGYTGRSLPFDGSDPLAHSKGGFIWDAALAKKKTVRVYGEYAGYYGAVNAEDRINLLARWAKGDDFSREFQTIAPIVALNKILSPNYPSYTNSIPDVIRARIFLHDVKQWVTQGSMPNLVIVQLPGDHTFGTWAEKSTPKAMVADNDLALGQIVEGLTKTPFWKSMAIFVVEDDAQDGVDHVDGHRTVALAISPYIRRGHIDSTFYAHQSMTKTIGLILGLPALSLFELIANDMRASFQDVPDFAGYEAVQPSQSLDELNPPEKKLTGEARKAAAASRKMRWSRPDDVPSDRLNRILWGATRGWNTPYPGTKRAVLAPLSLEIEDDER
ncbi:MAG: bifunctional YncE family protein/alkaline phosphatase family protein [Bryobacteraceae bacterium]|nr:bifunctional YncE family protein/alkaline phosphatase family protein [Bryobacteraceae bacterium]